jgi:hypothetical protein
LKAIVVAPAAILFALSGSARGGEAHQDADTVVGAESACCAQVTATTTTTSSWAASALALNDGAGEAAPASRASRWRLAANAAPRTLAAGVANERGLQVKTVLAARAVSAAFPEITNIGGVRPDPLPWHPRGLAIDIMIPNPSSAAGIALGNEIVRFAFKNADRFALQDVIWRGTYYTPRGPSGSGYGHYDHVHITTHGAGYPTGREIYVR